MLTFVLMLSPFFCSSLTHSFPLSTTRTSTTIHFHSALNSSNRDLNNKDLQHNDEKGDLIRQVGEGALQNVQQLGQLTRDKPLLSETYFGKGTNGIGSIFSMVDEGKDSSPGIYTTNRRQLASPTEKDGERQVWQALANLESDSE